MILKFDFSDFARVAKNIGAMADQIPFALAGALNDAAEKTRTELATNTWPSSVHARNRSFLSAALTTRGERATKQKLSVAIYDRLGRGNLLQHDRGGKSTARRGKLAIPSSAVGARRGSRGVPARLKPAAIPNSFVTDGSRANTGLTHDAIYQRVGKYTKAGKGAKKKGVKAKDNRKLKLMYVLKPSVSIKADVPFDRDFERSMRSEVGKAFAPRLRAAMATRRAR